MPDSPTSTCPGSRVSDSSKRPSVLWPRVETTATVWLGLTVGCARCHDHKIDPFLQKDYYRLSAFFQNIRPFNNDNLTPIEGTADEAESIARRRQERHIDRASMLA